MSIRKEIRYWLRDALLNGTQAQDRIYVNRRAPLNEGTEYPLVLIYSEPEDAVPARVTDYSYVRTYQVTIDIRVLSESVDDDLDDIAEEIEAIMAEKTDSDYGQNVSSFEYLGAEPTVDDEGEEKLGSLRLNYSFKYFR